MTAPQQISGFMPFRDHQTWFEVTGELSEEKAPLIALHGGPGVAHNYLQPMRQLAMDGQAVILYDQLGCGRSTHLPDAPEDFWSVDLFLEELDALLQHLSVSKYHLYGQSWGGMLAAEHAVRQPLGLTSLILSNSLASSDLWALGATRLRAQLPAESREALEQHEAAGTISHPKYLAAVDEYYARHVCRVALPDFVKESFDQLSADPTVYEAMWGPNEFAPVGSLKNWSIIDRLDQITVPTLVVSGEFDEATSECQEPFIERIASVQHVAISDASHLSMVEEPHQYFKVLTDFLSEVTRR